MDCEPDAKGPWDVDAQAAKRLLKIGVSGSGREEGCRSDPPLGSQNSITLNCGGCTNKPNPVSYNYSHPISTRTTGIELDLEACSTT